MCGICGFHGFKNDELLKKMSEVISYRGPDGYGFYSNELVSLGHKRLKIIDLSEKGKQPMSNSDGTIWLTYNGEIYNFQEIKKSLENKGYKFKSNSDTEVIIYAYEEYGEKCLQLFNGMFAFALWDSKKKKLFIARDRIGIKPLYYFLEGNKFIFASEIKSILQDETIKAKLNEEALVDYLTFQYTLGEKTFFKDIKTLLPGHYLTWDGKDLNITKYWDINYNKKLILGSKKEYLEEFRRIFKKSVKRHLVSDVEIGVYLSGGFDSTSVATIASELIDTKIKTFTANFNEKGKYDETSCSRIVGKNINAEIYEKTITANDFIQKIFDVIYHLDEPKAGTPSISQYHISKKVSEKVKVVLTGHGGDELFSGYHVYKVYYLKELIKNNPLNIFKLFTYFKPSELFRSFYFLVYPFFTPGLKKTGLFVYFNNRERKKLLTPSFYNKIKKYDPSRDINKYYSKNMSSLDKLQQSYLKVYLPSLLIVEDKMGMAHSIEARMPFCDQELVEFAMSIPMGIKLANKELKYIIKEGMRDKLPPILYDQPKKGFPTPIPIWLRKELKGFVYELLLGDKCRSKDIFNKDYVKKLLDSYCNSNSSPIDLYYVNKIWCLINVEIWLRLFVYGDSDSFCSI